MPANLEVTISVRQDGKTLSGFPIYRRVQVDEAQAFSVEQATGGGYVALPTSLLDTLQLLLLRPSKGAVTVRLNNQSDAGITVQQGGLLLLVDTSIASGATTNAKVDNSSGTTVVLDGLAGGT